MAGARNFDRVIGAGRGVVDARAANDRLCAAEDELALARREASALQSQKVSLEREITELQQANGELNAEAVEAEEGRMRLVFERDLARYALVRAGQFDPVCSAVPVHQGAFCAGRPYLREHHVLDAENNYCYRTDGEGVPAGRVPGRSRRWVRCEDDAGCPAQLMAMTRPAFGSHPLSNGRALRQEVCWWDAQSLWWFIDERSASKSCPQALTREHLLGCINFLREHALRLWQDEWRHGLALPPCPANAYESASAFLADTPLMRALLAEKRRRRIRGKSASMRARYELAP